MSLDVDQAVDRLLASLQSTRPVLVATPNVNHLMRSRRDPRYFDLLSQFDFLFADGMPIVWASTLMLQPLPGRVTGADLLPQISKRIAGSDMSVFIAGTASEQELYQAKIKLESSYPGLKVSSYFPPQGFDVSDIETNKLISAINASSPSFVFLGVGSPKQEEWFLKNSSRLPSAVYIGCGMAIGFITGEVRRAPKVVQKLGFEWIWRIYQEPRRLFQRYLYDLTFVSVAFNEISSHYLRTLKSSLRRLFTT